MLDAAPPIWPAALEGRDLSKDDGKIYLWSEHFANVLSEATHTFMDSEAGQGATSEPDAADAIVAASRLLGDIARCEPSLIAGPLRSERQHWTRTGNQILTEGVPEGPASGRFVSPRTLRGKLAVKPFDVGLYTSTATTAGCSMWRVMFGPNESEMWPRPWYTWEMERDSDEISVAEIGSAKKWVEFVSDHAVRTGGWVYPDWSQIAEEFDAVHITLPAVAAAQGFHFRTEKGLIPPAFWDVETTLWLNWRFSGARLIEVVNGD